MSTLKELREKRARTYEAAKAALDAIPADASKEVRAEKEREFDAAMADYDSLDAQIVRHEKLQRAASEEQREQEENAEIERRNRRPGGNGSAPGAGAGGEKPDVRAAWKEALLYGWGGISEEARSVLSEKGIQNVTPQSIKDPEMRALTVGTGSSGGFTVPTEFLPVIRETMALWGPMLNPNVIDLMETTSGNPIEMPTTDDTARRGSQFAENAEITDDGGEDPVFGQVTLSSYMMNSEIVRVPIQLMADSAFDVEKRIIKPLFGKRMARTANDKLTIGDGSSKPQGIVNGAGAGITAAAVAAFAADELIDLQHTIDPAYRQSPKAAWMFNDTVLKLARKLKDSENRYIWQAPDLKTGAPATLLDKPFYINPSMVNPAAGTVPIIFGDLEQFIVRQVGDFQVFVFRERYMNLMQLGFMAWGRLDGRMVESKAIKKMTMAAS